MVGAVSHPAVLVTALPVRHARVLLLVRAVSVCAGGGEQHDPVLAEPAASGGAWQHLPGLAHQLPRPLMHATLHTLPNL